MFLMRLRKQGCNKLNVILLVEVAPEFGLVVMVIVTGMLMVGA